MSQIPQFPHDMTDLALAPVVLRLEDQLESYRGLSQEEIVFRIALETNLEPRTNALRHEALLEALVRDVDLHGWTCTWSDRGLRVGHDGRVVTLGLPTSVRTYLIEG